MYGLLWNERFSHKEISAGLYPQLRKRYWGQHVWSRGYCVSSVGLDEERIKKYVKWLNRKAADSDAKQGREHNPIQQLSVEEIQTVDAVAWECVNLFQPSSSCVEEPALSVAERGGTGN